MKKRILFVDDEPNILQGLRRMLHSMRHEWDMTFANGGHEALQLLAQAPCDVVVSDMRMPGMDGVQLLTQVMERYPCIVRIVLSGYADREMNLGVVGTAHQCLSKPCDAALIKASVTRAGALRELLADEPMQRLVSGMKTLPSLPTLYHEVLEAVQDPDSLLQRVGEIIGRDMGMTTKMLQLANSGFFGPRRHVSSLAQVVSLLGPDTVKGLILSVELFTHFDQAQARKLSLNTLWQHSMAVSAQARSIARVENCERQVIDDVFTAGLLHDVGKLVFAVNLPERYSEALALMREHRMAEWEAERATLGATHAEVGAYLLGLWGLPDSIVEALAFHDAPSRCPNQHFSPLTAVHVADALVHEGRRAEAGGAPSPVDLEYLAGLGLSDRLAVWREPGRIA